MERFGGYYKNRDLGMLMYTKFKTGMPPGTPRRFSVSPSNRQPSTGAGSNWPVSCALRTICHQAFCQQADNCPESISVVCLVGRSKVDNHGIGLPKRARCHPDEEKRVVRLPAKTKLLRRMRTRRRDNESSCSWSPGQSQSRSG